MHKNKLNILGVCRRAYRLTVAGDATARSWTSKSMCMNGVNLIRSLLARHNILLSSSTVFMFSIHSASTGPSQITHWCASDVSWTRKQPMSFQNYWRHCTRRSLFISMLVGVQEGACPPGQCMGCKCPLSGLKHQAHLLGLWAEHSAVTHIMCKNAEI